MYEGIDLPYDAARWQALTKVPYPSLAEPAIKYLADKDPEWYQWETAKLVLQASGRVVRASDDWGITYILDSSFEQLYEKAEHLFPQWWQDSLAMMSLE
jgi:Rad3-related DNA helicase